jgi:DNA-binding NtrC family response regulator
VIDHYKFVPNRCHPSPTADAALQALATTRFTVVLTDYGVTHQTASRVITRAHQLAPMPVIVLMTGHSRERLADHLATLPITAFLPKPFTLATLYATLDQCVAAHRAHPASPTARMRALP